MKADGLCRGCSSGVEGASLLLATLRIRFTACTGLQIEENDGLPLNICNECITNINHCYEFINTCKRTDNILRELIINGNNDNPDDLLNTDDMFIKDEHVIKEEEGIVSDNGDDCLSDNQSFSLPESSMRSDVAVKNEHKSNISKLKNGVNKKVKIKTCKIKKSTDYLSANELNKDANCTTKKNYNCPICVQTFVGKSSFKSHMTEVHPDFKKFVCSFCPKSFTKSQYLKQHLITHSGKCSFACSLCPKKFKQQCQLIQHRKLHSKEKPFKCDKCDMSFHLRNGMISHSKQHDYNLHHLCHLCGQGFAQLGNLMVHMRVHTGEKPYACSSCSFRCSVQSGMRRHERTHANLRPNVCTICQKAFNNSGSLARHARIHTGELPYKCSLCPMAFIDSWKRKNHLVKAHHMSLIDIPRMFPGRKKIYTNEPSKDNSSYIKSEPS